MEITITDENANQRVDKFVKKYLNMAPLSFIYRIFRQKDVKVNGKRVDIQYILQEGDVVFIYLKDEMLEQFSKPQEIRKTNTPFEILYEDHEILIVNKPAGLLVHGDAEEKRITLANIVLNYLVETGDYNPATSLGFVPGPAHRLDRNTSGVVIFGKTLPALQELLNLFREKTEIHKEYLALVCGELTAPGTIDYPLIKDSDKGIVKIGRIEKGAKSALTKYKVETRYRDYTLLRAELITGRTHQLRVHFQAIHHPIVGDAKYGDFKVNHDFDEKFHYLNQFLHAESIEFYHPSGVLAHLSGKKIVAPLPSKEQRILDSLIKIRS